MLSFPQCTHHFRHGTNPSLNLPLLSPITHELEVLISFLMLYTLTSPVWARGHHLREPAEPHYPKAENRFCWLAQSRISVHRIYVKGYKEQLYTLLLSMWMLKTPVCSHSGVIRWSTLQHCIQRFEEGWVLWTVIWHIRPNESHDAFHNPNTQESNPVIHWEKSQCTGCVIPTIPTPTYFLLVRETQTGSV